MPTLQIEFYCLCLFVRDPAYRKAHVVMPATEAEKHMVMLHHLSGGTSKRLGRMEGLELVLGPEAGPGSADLDPLSGKKGGEVVNLTRITENANGKEGVKAPLSLAIGIRSDVVSRVRLGMGTVIARIHDAKWSFKGKQKKMAHTVVWQIDDVPDALNWNKLAATGVVPLQKLSKLGAPEPLPRYDRRRKQKYGYRLLVSHTMGDDPVTGELDEKQVREHFRHFYHVLDHWPKDDELPNFPDRVGKFNCGTSQVELG